MSFDSRTGIEIIDRAECLALLASDSIGRLAIDEGGVPLILPVNYGLDGERIVLRTGDGAKLDAVHRPVCFEIDHFDRVDRAGWSVVVRGRLVEVPPADRARFEQMNLPPRPWADGERHHILYIEPTVVTGRRVNLTG